jgi:hypothetical protein
MEGLYHDLVVDDTPSAKLGHQLRAKGPVTDGFPSARVHSVIGVLEDVELVKDNAAPWNG